MEGPGAGHYARRAPGLARSVRRVAWPALPSIASSHRGAALPRSAGECCPIRDLVDQDLLDLVAVVAAPTFRAVSRSNRPAHRAWGASRGRYADLRRLPPVPAAPRDGAPEARASAEPPGGRRGHRRDRGLGGLGEARVPAASWPRCPRRWPSAPSASRAGRTSPGSSASPGRSTAPATSRSTAGGGRTSPRWVTQPSGSAGTLGVSTAPPAISALPDSIAGEELPLGALSELARWVEACELAGAEPPAAHARIEALLDRARGRRGRPSARPTAGCSDAS